MNQPIRDQWIKAIEQFQEFDYTVQSYHVCSLHFLPSDIDTNRKRNKVILGRVPSIFPDADDHDANNLRENIDIENEEVPRIVFDPNIFDSNVTHQSVPHQSDFPENNDSTTVFLEDDDDEATDVVEDITDYRSDHTRLNSSPVSDE